MPDEEEIRQLILHENEDRSGELYRLELNEIIQLKLSPSLAAKKVRVFTNAIVNESDSFDRSKYNELKWIYPSNGKYDDSDRYLSLKCVQPGSFHFYFTIDRSTSIDNRNGQGYFQVQPQLKRSNGTNLCIDGITCQSILSKSLGQIEDWLSRLEVTYQSGYNMIHLTPIQLLYHVSNSSYAITDHHQLNPSFNGSINQLKDVIEHLYLKWNIFSITDLVYNHAANDCALLRDHPEAAYNLINSPHLKPAVLLDSILMQFTLDASENKLISFGIPSEIKEHHLNTIRHYLSNEQINKYRFYEFYICDVKSIVDEFRQQLLKVDECPDEAKHSSDSLLQLQHGKYDRMKTRVDLQLAEEIYFFKRKHLSRKDEWIDAACQSLQDRIHFLNHIKCEKLNEDLSRAVDNCLASCRYHFFSFDGPQYQRLSLPKTPFVGNYFHYPNDEFKHPDEINELIGNDVDYQVHVMAHNGWVMNDDPLRCFADEGQFVYLRRDLLQWSDIVKLRFGNQREDSPALYDYMKEYTRLIATTFHGCRLDNCHSTPLWFAQEMMDYARQINPNFYINAELFTGNIQMDIQFINQIGINSLVRESYRAFDPYELGQITSSVSEGNAIGSLIPCKTRLLTSNKPYSWFYDQTHDNPCQLERRSVEDVLSRSAIVAMAHCSTGSTRGYDELVPHHIDVVHETRLYPRWTSNESNSHTGMIELKKSLNNLHVHLAEQGFTQLLIDQLSTSVLLITRHNPISHQSVILIASTSFFKPTNEHHRIQPISIQGFLDEILIEGSLSHPYDQEPIEEFQRSKSFINGLTKSQVYLDEHVSFESSRLIRLTSPNGLDYQGYRTIELTDEFRPGSIVVIQISPLPQMRQCLINLNQLIQQFSNKSSQFNELVGQLTLVDVERVLYRSSNEEQSDGKGFDVYVVPDCGSMSYCGLQGQISLLNSIRLSNDLKHPLVHNLKQGNWLMEYVANRLKVHSTTKSLGQWFENAFGYVSQLSRLMIPSYFDLIIRNAHEIVLEHSYSLMSPFIRQSSTFVRDLSQTSVELISVVRNARLPLLSPNLREPKPNEEVDEQTFERIQLCPSLAAGLPHFASGIWRNWGRDTFISLRGLLLLTGRYEEARYLILSYGGCLRHGLIPNLLGDGKIARYNARDAVWWWLYSISNYCQLVSDGHEILSDKVSRLYPTHESPMQLPGAHDQHLFDVIQEVFLRHLQLLNYRERGAGHSLDNDMNDQGFNNQIGIDTKTGFVYGGNRWNCGTWMDKMGSSDKAGNKGHPATPRDGSAIELVGLCRSTLAWIIQMNQQGFYPYDSVETSIASGGKLKLLFTDWLTKIDENFEKSFWINENDSSEFVNRREIYKDTVNSSLKWTDFQFRPNFLVAAVVAPEMFDKHHIWLCLQHCERILIGKYGIKTLDPSDYNYIGNYVNDDDSYDYKRAKGFNYHNGPEWLWLTGYYIRAKLYWAKQQNDNLILKQTRRTLKNYLASHIDLLNSSISKGLPELTNENGQFCPYSCSVQAWSASTLIEAFYDLTRS